MTSELRFLVHIRGDYNRTVPTETHFTQDLAQASRPPGRADCVCALRQHSAFAHRSELAPGACGTTKTLPCVCVGQRSKFDTVCWERGAHCGHVTRVIVRVSPRWHWQVFSGRRLVTRLLLASSDLSTIKALHQELTKLVTDMQVCV